MDTIVWSMKVIETAKIIAVRIRLFDFPPLPAIASLPRRGTHSDGLPAPGATPWRAARPSGPRAHLLSSGGAAGASWSSAPRLPALRSDHADRRSQRDHPRVRDLRGLQRCGGPPHHG